MSLRRSTREKRKLPEVDEITNQKSQRWQFSEKHAFLEAAKKYGIEDPDMLSTHIGTRTPSEVRLFLQNAKVRSRTVNVSELKKTKSGVPIESWQNLIDSLMDSEEDFSIILAQVISIAGNLESHTPRLSSSDADYKAIYRYIVALLKDDPLPELAPIECKIMLDLMQGLVHKLQSADKGDVHKLMQAKFQLLSAPADSRNSEASHERFRHGLQDDLLHEEGSTSSSQSPGANSQQTSTTLTRSTDSTTVTETAGQNGHTNDRNNTQNGTEQVASALPERGPLYSINPLGIPVKHLKLRRKRKPASAKQSQHI